MLLHLFAVMYKHDIVVAHFDHGIRGDSAADARFVEGLARMYGAVYEARREKLGENASEELARERRYKFLFETADKHKATLVTAHHRDDVVESIAINLMRGTGWRGLAVMDDPRITRPLLGYSKRDIYAYALRHRLEWVEDETNAGQVYLRNRLRLKAGAQLSEKTKRHLLSLRADQLRLRRLVEQEAARLGGPPGEMPRYRYIMAGDDAADELLRDLFMRAAGTPLTRPQRRRALMAIKTARPGSVVEAGEGVSLNFSRAYFVVATSRRMV